MLTNRFITRDSDRPLEKIEVFSKIVPYTDPEDFWRLTRSEVSGYNMFVQTNNEGKVDFSGRYDSNLMDEIYKYSIVAAVIAEENEFDVIHAHDWLAYPAGIAAMEVSGKPLVIHVHATDFDRSGGNVNPDVYRIEKRRNGCCFQNYYCQQSYTRYCY